MQFTPEMFWELIFYTPASFFWVAQAATKKESCWVAKIISPASGLVS